VNVGSNVSEEHIASVFRAKLGSVSKWIIYMGLEEGSGYVIDQSEPRNEGSWRHARPVSNYDAGNCNGLRDPGREREKWPF
jgi:hypothetical protein